MNPDMLNTLNHAAAQSDRWLFLAMIALGMASGAVSIRWLVGEFRTLAEKMASVVQANTDAMKEVKETLKDCPARISARQ